MSCCSSSESFKILEKRTQPKGFLIRVKPYQPLLVMIACILTGSLVLSHSSSLHWMPVFMGLFLLNFAMFKLFDLDGFAKSFAMYDIIGKRSAFYAKTYPFIELALAIGFLSHRFPEVVNVVTAVVMIVGLIGIIQNRLSGTQVRCACMGSLINVPVGSITILENTSMALMAIMNIMLSTS